MKDTPLGSRMPTFTMDRPCSRAKRVRARAHPAERNSSARILEAIIALPLNIFYNTGIATYVWVLSNRKVDAPQGQGPAHRRDQVVPAAPPESRQAQLRDERRTHP